MTERLWLAYLDMGAVQKDETTVTAPSVSEAVEEAEKFFVGKYPEIKNGGYSISVEKAVGTSNTIEPDYHDMGGEA